MGREPSESEMDTVLEYWFAAENDLRAKIKAGEVFIEGYPAGEAKAVRPDSAWGAMAKFNPLDDTAESTPLRLFHVRVFPTKALLQASPKTRAARSTVSVEAARALMEKWITARVSEGQPLPFQPEVIAMAQAELNCVRPVAQKAYTVLPLEMRRLRGAPRRPNSAK